jgi:adenylosuccinate synthase
MLLANANNLVRFNEMLSGERCSGHHGIDVWLRRRYNSRRRSAGRSAKGLLVAPKVPRSCGGTARTMYAREEVVIKARKVKDDIHGYIHYSNLEGLFISHPLVLRLHQIRQNGAAYLTYLHTVVNGTQEFRLRMMPVAAAINNLVDVYFGAGTLIHMPTLEREIQELKYGGRLVIHPKAGIITDDIVQQQRADDRYATIGSTLTGTGLASALRAQRKLELASDYQELKKYRDDECNYLERILDPRRRVLVEGHQGFGLSNYHGDYPYTSSRDSIAAAMLSELGIGPRQKDMHIVLVVKLFPTRNHAGALSEEISESDRKALGIQEYGGGSWGLPDQQCRVGLFDIEIVRKAVFANSPTEIALTGADYFDHSLRGANSSSEGSGICEFIRMFAKHLPDTPIKYVSTGRDTISMIVLEGDKKKKRKKSRNQVPDLFSRDSF